MKTDEALKRLRELKDIGDEENAHVEADNILLDLIGDDEIRQAFRAISKWYA